MLLIDLPRMESFDRISRIPVVETGFEYASEVYYKIKGSNPLVSWSLNSMEGSLHKVVTTSLPLIELPLGVVDTIVCKTLDEVELRVPAINYQPDQLMNITKDLVTKRIVQPVIKRADSVKQFSVNNPRLSKYSEMAVSRLDTALDKADEYVEKYLPDSSDCTDSKGGDQKCVAGKGENTIQHAQRLSKKLQRRLTKRTLAEARALKKTGHDIAECLHFLLDLLMNDPKEFSGKMVEIWAHLSEDEPENQIPPANIDQLLALVARESARHLVHAVNYFVVLCGHLPSAVAHWAAIANHHVRQQMDYVIKTANLDGVGAAALGIAELQLLEFIAKLNKIYGLLFGTLINNKSDTKSAPIAEIEGKKNSPQPSNHQQQAHKHREPKASPDNDRLNLSHNDHLQFSPI